MSSAVFSPVGAHAQDRLRDACALHVGDTWMEPFSGGRMQDLSEAEHPGLHRYCPARGVPALVDAIVEKVRASNGLPCERESVLVSAGATGALGAAVGAIASPGDEVLILAPHWPLIAGIVSAFRATPVLVPFYDRVSSPGEAVDAVSDALGSRAVALYVSTPSNPTGRVLPQSWLEALGEWAASEGLWLLVTSDGLTFQLFDVERGQLIGSPISTRGLNALALSLDGSRLATTRLAGMIQVWDTMTGRPALPPIPLGGWVLALVFSADGTRLIGGGNTRQAQVWDATTGEPIEQPMSHRDDVGAAAFSRDGRFRRIRCAVICT